MNKYYYTKKNKKNVKGFFRILSLCFCLIGIILILYIFFPLISWQVYFEPVFASADVAAPIPKTTIVSRISIKSLIAQASQSLGTDYLNAQTWFPAAKLQEINGTKVSYYYLSIPKLGIKKATVSTTDYELASHLVNYGGTAIPPDNGNAVVFGHSTLPQLFNPKDYKTIFANAYKLQVGDNLIVDVGDISYDYKIYSITIVDPTDMSVFTQTLDNSYVTIVTCTPPGTTWKRLVIRARLEKI